ncbi:hypothetical protein [uncultured Nostoc sp.]|uniref:hypothetical protein n=1 Tax=uncultured Nostoc sp. TaxID=340711 RepID=UPI0035CBB39C
MTLIVYLKAKISEYSIILQRIEQQIQLLDKPQSNHILLLQSLKQRLLLAKESYGKLTMIVKVGNVQLLSRGLEQLHLIEFETYIIAYLYIPALQNEGLPELAIRKVLLSIIQRLYLVWIRDLIVKLDGQLATIPGLETPLFIAPPKAKISLLEMPGLYHEIGHNFFRKFTQDLLISLKKVVNEHFSLLRKKTGFIPPDQDKVYKRAAGYWDDKRLEELFCDIFGTWSCGIAHYVSCVDMGLLYEDDPHKINFDDEHPPMCARVYICWITLTKLQQLEDLTKVAESSWIEHLKMYAENPDHRLICHKNLLNSFVETAVSKIEEYLPNSKRYDTDLPNDTEIEQFNSNLSFEDILNRAAKILLMFPERYTVWETNAMNFLGWYDN